MVAEITWFLSASKKNILSENNYSSYSQYDNEYLISSSLMEEIIELLNSMKYEIINIEFDNHRTNSAEWIIYFQTNDNDELTNNNNINNNVNNEKINKNIKKMINFQSGRYKTTSIYLKEDINLPTEEGWTKIY
jgi:hypothetical protein